MEGEGDGVILLVPLRFKFKINSAAHEQHSSSATLKRGDLRVPFTTYDCLWTSVFTLSRVKNELGAPAGVTQASLGAGHKPRRWQRGERSKRSTQINFLMVLFSSEYILRIFYFSFIEGSTHNPSPLPLAWTFFSSHQWVVFC